MLPTGTTLLSNSNNLSPNTDQPGNSEIYLSRKYPSPTLPASPDPTPSNSTNLNSKSGPCTLVIPNSQIPLIPMLRSRRRGKQLVHTSFQALYNPRTRRIRYNSRVSYN